MAECACCGREFDVSTARRMIGARYGAGTYNDYYPDGNVCEYCAMDEVGADYSAGAQVKKLMGDAWWDD